MNDVLRIPSVELYEFFQTPEADGIEYPVLVNGTSMQPMLSHLRDTVWLTRLKGPPRRGSVLLFRRENGQVVMHRVLRVKGDSLKMNGDGQVFTEWIPKTKCVAVVAHFTHRGRDISCQAPFYRLCVCLWMAMRPLRPRLFHLHGIWKRFWKRGTPCGKS